MSDRRTWHDHEGAVLDSARGFDVISCSRCGYSHIVPIPTREDLEGLYRENYYAREKPLYLEGTRRDLDWWNLVYRDRYDTFEGLLPPDRRRILDVGSGPGFFLLHGKERGWVGTGIEPSSQAAAHSRDLGLDVVEDFLEERHLESLGRFDVVHMSEVLEHIAEPRRLLAMAWELLLPGGLLCVVVPNDYNPFQAALRTACGFKPWWVAPPHHINYFDFDSLERLFAAGRFDVVAREATFPIDMFLLMGDNYVGNDELGRVCHGKRMQFEANLAEAGLTDLRRELYKCFARAGIGREVVMVGRKGEQD